MAESTALRAKRRRALRGAALGALAAAAAAALGLTDAVETDAGLPLLYAVRGAQKPPPHAAIVALDTSGLEALRFAAGGQGPAIGDAPGCLPPGARARLAVARSVEDLPREMHACLARALSRAGVRARVFDVHFAEIGDGAGDAFLAAALAEGPPAILLERVEIAAPLGGALRRRPSRRLREAAAAAGFFLVERRPGHVLRHVEGVAALPGALSLPRAVLGALGDAAPPTRAPSPPDAGVSHGYFRFYGPAGTVPIVPLTEALSGAADARLAGRTVFVGAADPDLREARDVFPSPFARAGGPHSGVELIATAYLNLREGGGLRRPGLEGDAALAGAAAFGPLWAALALPGLGGALAALGFGALAAALAAAAFASGLWLPVAAPALLLAPAASAAALLTGFLRQRGVLEKVLPASLGAEAAAGTLEAAFPQRAAVLFVDVAGSTGLAERLGPRAYSDAVNAVFAAAEKAVAAERGEILKFTGDGLLAAFRPLGREGPGPDAVRAVAAARALAATAQAAARAGPAPRLRMGVEAGEIAVGYVGGPRRGAVDALGDAVNVAARLQELGRFLRPDAQSVVLVGPEAAVAAAEAHPLTPCGDHALRGRAVSVAVREAPT